LIRCKSPSFPKDFFNRNGTSPRPAPRSGCPSRPALPYLSPQTRNGLHREQAVIGRIFQALPTQTDTVALIYKIMIVTHKCIPYIPTSNTYPLKHVPFKFSPTVFPIARHFNPTCLVQSPPLHTYIGEPKGEALYLSIESSILGYLHSFNFFL